MKKKQPKKGNKKKKDEILPAIQEEKKSEETENGEGEKKESWISWTKPEFVEKNNRWEFYQIDKDKNVLEIYHSESESEIKGMHKRKVMSHIMAAMHQPKPERKKEGEKISIQEAGIHKGESTGKKKSDGTVFLHQQAKFDIMTMKLQGVMYHEMVSTIKERYGLTLMTIGLYFSQVLNDIRERAKGTLEKTVQDHLERYENLFKWFRENGYSKAALKALERKEKLLGLHDGEKVEQLVLNGLVENGLGRFRYNWDQLSDQERERLVHLVKRCIIVLPNKKEEGKNETQG